MVLKNQKKKKKAYRRPPRTESDLWEVKFIHCLNCEHLNGSDDYSNDHNNASNDINDHDDEIKEISSAVQFSCGSSMQISGFWEYASKHKRWPVEHTRLITTAPIALEKLYLCPDALRGWTMAELKKHEINCELELVCAHHYRYKSEIYYTESLPFMSSTSCPQRHHMVKDPRTLLGRDKEALQLLVDMYFFLGDRDAAAAAQAQGKSGGGTCTEQDSSHRTWIWRLLASLPNGSGLAVFMNTLVQTETFEFDDIPDVLVNIVASYVPPMYG